MRRKRFYNTRFKRIALFNMTTGWMCEVRHPTRPYLKWVELISDFELSNSRFTLRHHLLEMQRRGEAGLDRNTRP